jgi:Domain of unknown function (DUF4326)
MPETSVIRLNGRQRELGPALELAPHITYIGRAIYQGGWCLPGSAWANPFKIRQVGGFERAVALYTDWLADQPDILARLHELRGRVLGCWCMPGGACHGLVLARLADRSAPTGIETVPRTGGA